MTRLKKGHLTTETQRCTVSSSVIWWIISLTGNHFYLSDHPWHDSTLKCLRKSCWMIVFLTLMLNSLCLCGEISGFFRRATHNPSFFMIILSTRNKFLITVKDLPSLKGWLTDKSFSKRWWRSYGGAPMEALLWSGRRFTQINVEFSLKTMKNLCSCASALKERHRRLFFASGTSLVLSVTEYRVFLHPW